MFGILADATVVLHFSFVLFAVFGGLLVAWRRWVIWLHLPAAIWGVWIEFSGRICPLTYLENWLRRRGDRPTYATSFVEHYIIPILYPASLTLELQWVLGGVALAVNAVVYFVVLRQRGRR